METKPGAPKAYTIDEIKAIAVPIAQKYGVKKLALFGSYARGEQTGDSDIDFITEPKKGMGLAFFGFADELENEFDTQVDVLTYRGLNNSRVFNEIDAEVVLYETQ